MNPCKCGYFPDRNRCRCSQQDIEQHFRRLSRPIMDRIDICVNAPRVGYNDMEKPSQDQYTSQWMQEQVRKTYEIQRERYKGQPFDYNSQIPASRISYYCTLEKDAKDLIKLVYDKYDLSARSYHKVMKVARTIADIEGNDRISFENVSEAIGYKTEGMCGKVE